MIASTCIKRVAARRMFSSKPLYTAPVTVKGARQGFAKGENLSVELAMSKALGGTGGKTNPEELFAAGYGACFQSAMNAVAMQRGIKFPAESVVESNVALCGDMKKLDLFLEVELVVKKPADMDKKLLQEIVDAANKACPYSRAVKGNVPVSIRIE